MEYTETIRRTSPVDVSMPPWGVCVLESHHAATFRMEPGRWPFHKLCWVSIGKGSLELENAATPLERDDLVLIPQNVRHCFEDDPSNPLTLVIACASPAAIETSPDLSQTFEDAFRKTSPGQPLRPANAYHRSGIRDLFRTLLREQTKLEPGHTLALRAALANLMVSLLRHCTPAPVANDSRQAAIRGAVDYLDIHFDKPAQIADLAARCGLSARRFTDLFRQETGTTVVDYINRRRIAYACQRLRETGHILYACYESGFQDPGYFYRVFRKYIGQTPGAYIRTPSESTDSMQ